VVCLQYLRHIYSDIDTISLFTHRDPDYEIYYQLRKIVPRLVYPFLPIHQLLYYGSILYAALQSAENDDEEGPELGSEIELL
jgi:hypothetical protein